MKNSISADERIAKMPFGSVYTHYVAKVEKKGRTIDELHQVISWLTPQLPHLKGSTELIQPNPSDLKPREVSFIF